MHVVALYLCIGTDKGGKKGGGRAKWTESDGETRSKEAERGLSTAVVAVAGRVPSGCDSKPIAATGVQQLPAFKSTPSHTQQMFTKANKNAQTHTHTHFFFPPSNVFTVKPNICSCVFYLRWDRKKQQTFDFFFLEIQFSPTKPFFFSCRCCGMHQFRGFHSSRDGCTWAQLERFFFNRGVGG